MTRITIFISAFVSMALLTLIYTQVAQQPVRADSNVPAATASHDMSNMPGVGAPAAPATAAVEKDPNAAKYQLRDAAAPKPLAGTVHDIDLFVVEKPMTVADGFVQTVYAFGETEATATVPG